MDMGIHNYWPVHYLNARFKTRFAVFLPNSSQCSLIPLVLRSWTFTTGVSLSLQVSTYESRPKDILLWFYKSYQDKLLSLLTLYLCSPIFAGVWAK